MSRLGESPRIWAISRVVQLALRTRAWCPVRIAWPKPCAHLAGRANLGDSPRPGDASPVPCLPHLPYAENFTPIVVYVKHAGQKPKPLGLFGETDPTCPALPYLSVKS